MEEKIVMLDTKAKFHHLIPQVYMSAWEHGSGTLYVLFNNSNGEIVERNKEKVAGINHYHSIIAGMPICTNKDTDIIFLALKDLIVKYEGREIKDTFEMNKLYWNFNSWEIFRKDGTAVSKKGLKSKIDNVKIRDIEVLWSQEYESKWNQERNKIEDIILNATSNKVATFDKKYLMQFFIAADWRGFVSNSQFEEVFQTINHILKLDKIEMPKDERDLPMFESTADYFRHCLLLKKYREFLNGDGVISNHVSEALKATSFHFMVSDGKITFITSDNPAFIYYRKDGKLEGIMPITPRILMIQGRITDLDDFFYITHISENGVKKYNKIIKENSQNFVIVDNVSFDHFN